MTIMTVIGGRGALRGNGLFPASFLFLTSFFQFSLFLFGLVQMYRIDMLSDLD